MENAGNSRGRGLRRSQARSQVRSGARAVALPYTYNPQDMIFSPILLIGVYTSAKKKPTLYMWSKLYLT